MLEKWKSGIAGLFCILATQANAQDLQPYECAPENITALTKQWASSEARATLIDNRGSKARIERGRTYAKFMDAFWRNVERGTQKSSPKTTGDLLDLVSRSFISAYNSDAKAVLKKGVTPQIDVYSAHRNRPESEYASINMARITLSKDDLKKTPLSQQPDVLKILSMAEGETLDDGLTINIEFSTSWGDGIYMPVADGLAKYVANVTLATPVSALLGSEHPQHSNNLSYWGEINLKDHVICPALKP